MARPKRKPKPLAPEPPEFDGLTYKQRLFVYAYLGVASGNATEAARIAGYAIPKEQGSENLSKPHIRAAIAAKLAGPALSAEETLARLSDMASADLGDFASYYKRRTVAKSPWMEFDLGAAKRAGLSHLIRSIKPTRYGMAIELHDPLSALDKIARYHRLLAGADPKEDGDREDARISLARKLDDLAGRLRASRVSGEPDGG